MKSIHEGRIKKRVAQRIWDTLSEQEKAIIAADVEGKSAIGRWFTNSVNQETQAKYESPSYWMNDKYSFAHPAK